MTPNPCRIYRPLKGSLRVTVPSYPKWTGRRPWLPAAEYNQYYMHDWEQFTQWQALYQCGIPRPKDNEDGTWSVARKYVRPLAQALADRFGSCELEQEYNNRQKCDIRCREAHGYECVCSCLEQYHGVGGTDFDNGPGMLIGETTLVSVNGGVTLVRKTVIRR